MPHPYLKIAAVKLQCSSKIIINFPKNHTISGNKIAKLATKFLDFFILVLILEFEKYVTLSLKNPRNLKNFALFISKF